MFFANRFSPDIGYENGVSLNVLVFAFLSVIIDKVNGQRVGYDFSIDIDSGVSLDKSPVADLKASTGFHVHRQIPAIEMAKCLQSDPFICEAGIATDFGTLTNRIISWIGGNP